MAIEPMLCLGLYRAKVSRQDASKAGKFKPTHAAAAMIEAALPDDASLPGTWPDFARLLPHAQATPSANSAGIGRVGAYLGYSGNYATARALFHEVLDARKATLGPEHPDTLTARSNLGYWTGAAGDAAGARGQFAALLPVHERVLGPGHPDTLITRAYLAYWTGTVGDA